jgi:electron transport complex protein RnfC
MSSIFELIDQGQQWQFHGGIHPPSRKERTQDEPIIDCPISEKLYLPLSQHSGQPAICAVKVGDNIEQGQVIGHSEGFISANVLSPVNATVVSIESYAASHPSGLTTNTIVLAPNNNPMTPWTPLSLDNEPQDIIKRIKDSGITGLGGASFPTSVKLSPRQSIDILIINGAECEPYITADDALMRYNGDKIMAGILVMIKLLTPQRVIIAIEDNKPEAISAMTSAAKQYQHIIVRAIPTLYPAGGEKQLIEVITGQQVPSGKIPADVGVVVQNVATSYAIADAVFEGLPLLSRVVTVTGDLVERPGNYRVTLGTPVIDLLNFCGYKATSQQKLIMGGAMMGFALNDAKAPVIKATNCIISASNNELPDAPDEQNCIRCGDCEQVCPANLLPQQLQWFAKDKDHDKLTQHDLFDCIECGACAYVCPSHIPLVQYYRVAKAEIRENHKEQQLALRAKERFEQRSARLERDKQEREERNKIASDRRKAAMKSNNDGDAIAAAMARVKAKKSGQENATVQPTLEPAGQSAGGNDRVAAAIARAKSKKSAAMQSTQSDIISTPSQNPDKARVNDAIARAKAKRAAKLAEQATPAESESAAPLPNIDSTGDDKKARIAATIAKAKAKKASQQAETQIAPSNDETSVTPSLNANSTGDDKKARIAATIAKAKAKKAAQQAETQIAPSDEETSVTPSLIANSTGDDKKARIATAIAKAKAKKAALQTQNVLNNHEHETSETQPIIVDDKKVRIAAAIAKAKAKKLAQQTQSKDE